MKPRRTIERIPGPLASMYEKAARRVVGSYYSKVAEEVVSNIKEGTILDLGTGPGYLPIEIVKTSPSIKVDGIDLTRKLINMARTNASKAGVAHRVNFQVGNAAKLPFEDDSYDMVISTGMLHALKNPVNVLKECYRVLKRGGEAWIYDPAKVASQIDTKKWQASLSLRERFIHQLLTLLRVIGPPPTYNRKQVIEMIALTRFKHYWIEEEDDEIQIKLKK